MQSRRKSGLLLDVRNGLIEIESRSIRPDKPALRGIEMHVLHQITERVKGTLGEHSDTCKSSCNSAYYLKYALGIISHSNVPMISPDSVLDTTDPGDDVASRFNYQHCYAAINAIRLISDESVVAVICENHEDILVKRTAGNFIGSQIKTRALTLPPFKSTDPVGRERSWLAISVSPAVWAVSTTFVWLSTPRAFRFRP
jgi:hypothetical protein